MYDKTRGSIIHVKSHMKSMIEMIPSWKDWFKELMFYQYGIVYMGARMLNNVSASMMQFYLQYVLKVTGKGLTSPLMALFPLICFISAVLASSFMGSVYKIIGRKKTFTIGVILQAFASTSLMVCIFY